MRGDHAPRLDASRGDGVYNGHCREIRGVGVTVGHPWEPVDSAARRSTAARPAPRRSAPAPHRARPHAPRRPWTWMALLAVTAALVPLAAMEGGRGGATALAAAVAPRLPSPARAIVAATTPPIPPLRRPRPCSGTTPWRSAPRTPAASRAVSACRPRASATTPTTRPPRSPPGGRDRTWGTAMLVREVRSVARWWAGAHPNAPRLGIGDLSRETRRLLHRPGGGPRLPPERPGRGRPPGAPRRRREGRGSGTYDRALTQELVEPLHRRGRHLRLRGPQPGPARPQRHGRGRTTTTTSTSASPTRTEPATRRGRAPRPRPPRGRPPPRRGGRACRPGSSPARRPSSRRDARGAS